MVVVFAERDAHAVTCGTDQPPQKFWAVCGLAPRSRAFDETWAPEGSGTLVRWTDSEEVDHLGIVTIRHFISTGGDPGECVQTDAWYAYFKKCVQPPSWPPPTYWCPEDPNPCELTEEVARVRVTCFTMASGSFFGADCVLVGEIDPEDVECLAYITPMTIATPYELAMCRDDPVFIAGWGRTVDEDCKEVEARSLHVAATTISGINGTPEGRGGAIMIAPGSCVVEGACLPSVRNHDSGGAFAVERGDGSLALIGVTCCFDGSAVLAARHQFFSNPAGSEYLCERCRPTGCVDIVGPHGGPPNQQQDVDDRNALASMDHPRAAKCYCMGDLNGNGCIGDAGDIALVSTTAGQACDSNRGCDGDVDGNGSVNSSDRAIIGAVLSAHEGEFVCASVCYACPASIEWCQGDINCDGVVNQDDYDELDALLTQYGPFTCLWNAPGCTGTQSCP
ncbi:MAG: hypothetical protein JNK58_06285 [Phycisphaerae bacterium]|nr:hypothetical protein [Phycisphaerae bacterium]